jgi:hypothetical protein
VVVKQGLVVWLELWHLHRTFVSFSLAGIHARRYGIEATNGGCWDVTPGNKARKIIFCSR